MIVGRQPTEETNLRNDNELVWTVLEDSPAGTTLVGLYSSLETAREVVASLSGDRLQDYRIEGHVPEERRTEAPWQVRLTRDGEHVSTTPFVGCNCGDDEAQIQRLCFIEAGGEEMSVIVFAPTPGTAIDTAGKYRAWLQDEGFWDDAGRQLEPLQARVREPIPG
jgi:hypothetical protein